MNKKGLIVYFFILGLLMWGCSPTEERLALDQSFLNIADVVQYCQGPCDEYAEWEGSNINLKGYLRNAGNDSIQNKNKENNRFYMIDIRNGLFLEVRVTEDNNAIFDLLSSALKNDLIYLKGKALGIKAYNGSECTKGVVIEIDNVTDILINLE